MVQDNFPIGIWEVEGIYEYFREEAKWIYIDKYKPGSVLWEFKEGGLLFAYLDGDNDYQTKYLYTTEQNRLLIDQSYLEVLQNHNIKHIDHYRVDLSNPNEIWLYDLEDVEDEPNDYWLALKLNRNKKQSMYKYTI